MAVVRTAWQWMLLAALIVFLATAVLWLPQSWHYWLIMTGILAVAALGLHITTGLCGQFAMGHAAFIAIGAYTTAVLTNSHHLSPWVTLPISGLVAGVVGLVFGIPALRIKGIYLVMATIAAQFIIIFVIEQQSWTGGNNGIQVQQLSVGGSTFSNAQFWWLTLAVLLATVYFVKNISRTSPGRMMVAVRDNDLAAEVMGINLFGTKLLAFFIGCFFAGISGWLFAHQARFLYTSTFSFDMSLTLLGMVIIGGMGSTSGALLGTLFIRLVEKLVTTVSPDVARALPASLGSSALAPALQLLAFAAVVAVFLLIEPRGIQHRVEKLKLYYRLRPFSS